MHQARHPPPGQRAPSRSQGCLTLDDQLRNDPRHAPVGLDDQYVSQLRSLLQAVCGTPDLRVWSEAKSIGSGRPGVSMLPRF